MPVTTESQVTSQQSSHISAASAVSPVIDFSNFLSDDPAVVSAVCAIMPPASALVALEATLTTEQKQGFKFVYSEGGRLDNNPVYCWWSRIKDLTLKFECDQASLVSAETSENHAVIDGVLATAMDTSFTFSQSDMAADISGILDMLDNSAVGAGTGM